MRLILVEWTHNGAPVFSAGFELKTDTPEDVVELLQSSYLDGKAYYLPLRIPRGSVVRQVGLEEAGD